MTIGSASRHLRDWLVPFFIVAAGALLAYWATFSAGFVWDDYYFLFREGGWMLEASDWLGRSLREFYVFHGDAKEYSTNYFRPLVLVGFVAQMRLSGGDPAYLHGVSLAIHILNSTLVMTLARSWTGNFPQRRAVIIGAGLFYALHPALVESTAWISGQFDLLVTTFTLLALVADRTFRNSNFRAATVAAAFLLAALSKEAAVVLPIVLLITHWFFASDQRSYSDSIRSILRSHWKTYFLIFVCGLGYLYIRHSSLGHLFQPNGSGHSLAVRWNMFGYAYLEYWRLGLLPFYGLSPLHEVDPAVYLAPDVKQWARTLLSSTIFLAVFFFAIFKRSQIAFSACLFSAALLPVLHFLPMLIGLNLHAERFLTLPLALLAATIAKPVAGWVLSDAAKVRSRWAITGLVVVLWLTGALLTTRGQVPLWSNNQILWTWTYSKHPDSQFALNHLLADLLPRGNTEQVRDYVKDLEAKGEVDLGTAVTLSAYYANNGKFGAALTLINSVYRHTPPGSRMHVSALINYATILIKMDDPETAERVLRDVIRMAPESGDAHIYLVKTLAVAGKISQAEAEIPKALAKVTPLQRDHIKLELTSFVAAHRDGTQKRQPDREEA